jgi:hypothetical protein
MANDTGCCLVTVLYFAPLTTDSNSAENIPFYLRQTQEVARTYRAITKGRLMFDAKVVLYLLFESSFFYPFTEDLANPSSRHNLRFNLAPFLHGCACDIPIEQQLANKK